jgi:hypothetical protein
MGDQRSPRVDNDRHTESWTTNTDRRFRWSALCHPGEGLVGRGGVEPPTFRFSGPRCHVRRCPEPSVRAGHLAGRASTDEPEHRRMRPELRPRRRIRRGISGPRQGHGGRYGDRLFPELCTARPPAQPAPPAPPTSTRSSPAVSDVTANWPTGRGPIPGTSLRLWGGMTRRSFAGEHGGGLAFEVDVGLAADVYGDAVQGAAGEGPGRFARVVVGDRFAAVPSDA